MIARLPLVLPGNPKAERVLCAGAFVCGDRKRAAEFRAARFGRSFLFWTSVHIPSDPRAHPHPALGDQRKLSDFKMGRVRFSSLLSKVNLTWLSALS